MAVENQIESPELAGTNQMGGPAAEGIYTARQHVHLDLLLWHHEMQPNRRLVPLITDFLCSMLSK
jgi:hypothetical protein